MTMGWSEIYTVFIKSTLKTSFFLSEIVMLYFHLCTVRLLGAGCPLVSVKKNLISRPEAKEA